jgi:hypothetical protein
MKARTIIIPTTRSIVYNGWLVTTATIFGYLNILLLYIAGRSSISIYNSMPPGQRGEILFANAVSVAYATAVMAVLVIIASSIGGIFLSIGMKWVFTRLLTGTTTRISALVGAIGGVCWSGMMYLILYLALGNVMNLKYPETLLFWIIFPALACIAVSVAGAVKLNHYLQKKKSEHDLPGPAKRIQQHRSP